MAAKIFSLCHRPSSSIAKTDLPDGIEPFELTIGGHEVYKASSSLLFEQMETAHSKRSRIYHRSKHIVLLHPPQGFYSKRTSMILGEVGRSESKHILRHIC